MPSHVSEITEQRRKQRFHRPKSMSTHLLLRLFPAADVHHVRQFMCAAEPSLLFPLVPKAGMPEAVLELAAAAAHVHHTFPLVRRAADSGFSVESVDSVLFAALNLNTTC